jgi:5-methyltetrahydropteroyltriglutamate--homocysteine methyltransferase
MTGTKTLLPTSVVGSYAWPSWVHCGLEAARRGEFGPADIKELLDDAVDTALRDQEDAGVDVISDGEMRRAGFFTAAFYGHLTGLRALEPDRKVGAAGHDQQHRFEVLEPIRAPDGFGVVSEFEYARRRTNRPLKILIPGPFTLAGRLMPGTVYKNREAAAWAFVPLINAELKALVRVGAELIQIDEPSPAIHPEYRTDFSALFNAALEGVDGVRVASHLCFGNYVGRPLSKRTYKPVLDQIMQFKVDQLVLEFANRELAEVELLAEIAQEKEVAVGVVDVKNYYVESAEDVAQRIRTVLRYVPAEKLTLVPDCGFSETARWAARAKLKALVAGTRLVREELTGAALPEAVQVGVMR